jgi:preprotein translocase subunit SecY
MEGLKDAVGIIFTIAVVIGFSFVITSFSKNARIRSKQFKKS